MTQQDMIDDGLIDGKKSFEYLWGKIELHFRWDNVYSVMKSLDWQWAYGGAMIIPSINLLKNRAKEMAFEAYENESNVSTGGFHARYSDGGLELSFILEDWTSWDT